MLTKHEKRIISKVIENKNQIKKNHSAQGKYYDFIFLCGGEKYPNDNRSMIAKHVSNISMRESLYSEELFSFLNSLDLLTFEEILLEISTAVVIIVESWGSACELGAFSYVDANLDKLIVINDEKHKGKKSFINEGPLKKISQHNKEKKRVFFEKFKNVNDKSKLIISPELASEINDLPSKRSFRTEAFQIENNILHIRDISYLLWLIMDIIRLFGTIKKDNPYNLILGIFETSIIYIKNQSGNEIKNQDDVKNIVNFLLTVLIEFKMINVDGDDCKINFKYLDEKHVKLNNVTSVLFKEAFLKSRDATLMKASILNKAKKEGYVLWQ